MSPKIVIVGAGPTGTSIALQLTKLAPHLAEQTIILEASAHPRPKLCGGGITIHGEDQLRQLGIPMDVKSFQIEKVVFWLGERHFKVHHPQAMRIVQRSEFDAALAHAVQQTSIPIRNEKLLDVRIHESGVHLTTDRGTYDADVVIAADGAKSTVRRKMKLYGTESVARLLRVLTPVDAQRPPMIWQDRTAVFDFSCILQGVQGYMWDFPCYMDGQACVNRGIFDSRLAPPVDQPHGNLKQVFAASLRNRDVDLESVRLEGHPVRWFNPHAEFSRPRLLLAGDAAGVDPLFAEGISYGMHYADVVVASLRDAFASGDFSFTDYRSRLLRHSLGQLLLRRAAVARMLYHQRLTPFWKVLWRFAAVSPYRAKLRVGNYLAVLPA